MKPFSSLSDAIKYCCNNYTDICFILEGNSLYGDVLKTMNKNSMCITICDRMIYGKTTTLFRSHKFILNRIKANSFINHPMHLIGADIISDVLSLEKLLNLRNKKFVLIQSSFLLDDIWRLFIQAYLEKNNLATEIMFIKYNTLHKTGTTLYAINISTSLNGFKNAICLCKKISLSNFDIPSKALAVYHDINSPNSYILAYIVTNHINENDLQASYFNYLKDAKTNMLGLTDFDFYKLIYDKLKIQNNHQLAQKLATFYCKKGGKL